VLDQSWGVWAKLARYAAHRGADAQARSHLLAAQRAVVAVVSQVEVDDDPFTIMQDKARLQRELADAFLAAHQAGQATGADLRAVADFQASLVLSRRLAARWALAADQVPPAADAPTAVDPGALLRLGAAAVLQVLRTSGGLRLLLTNVSGPEPETRLLAWEQDESAADTLLEETTFKLVMHSPSNRADPLRKLGEWQALADSLRQAVAAAVPPGTPLVVVPGPLSGLPLHWALGPAYPLAYVPSLAVAALLHDRGQALAGQDGWRPATLQDMVVWQEGEDPAVVQHFKDGAAALAAALGPLGVAYGCTDGTASTRDSLLAALQAADCVRLACHGHADIDNGEFQLLVAADGRLPPSDPHALASAAGRRFLLDWEDITGLSRCAPVVFSTACASGMAICVRGGERVGLERPLFRAGALAYVAPQWPVPVEHVQRLMNAIITRYVGDRAVGLARAVQEEVNTAVEQGMPEWVARSVAVHGHGW
jgi:hypothetical protein